MPVEINEAILSAKRHLETIFDSITDPIIIIGPDYTIQRLNKAAADQIKGDYRTIIGAKCYEKFHQFGDSCKDCPIQKILAEKVKGSLIFRKKINNQEHIYDMRYFPLYDKNGEVHAIVEHYVDVTEGEVAKEKLREAYEQIMKEIMVAQKVQEALLPQTLPAIPGFAMDVYYKSQADVGGDLYDFIPIDTDHWGIIVVDVAGHGIPAALIGAMSKMSFYMHTPGNLSTVDVFEKVNTDLYGNLRMEHYLTGAYLIYNSLNNTLRFSWAGHPSGLLLRQATGKIEELNTDGFFLGMMSNSTYEGKEIKLQKGDRLVLYTDGIIDVQNRAKERFGIEGLKNTILANKDASLDDLKKNIISTSRSFQNNDEFNDDVTLVIIDVTHSDALTQFELTPHFIPGKEIRVFRADHPLNFETLIAKVLKDMDANRFADSEIKKTKYAIFEALDLFHDTAPEESTGLFIAWQCTHEEVRVVVVDKRFETIKDYTALYAQHHAKNVKRIEESMTRTVFLDSGRKLVMYKKNRKF